MKKILTLLAIALVGLTSCTPEEEEIVPPEPEQEAYLNVYYDDIVNRNDECTENGKENAQKTVTTVHKNQ